MDLIADILLVAGAVGAGLYCFVLARRLNRLNDLETGVGGAVAVLSGQVDDLTNALATAQQTAGDSAKSLESLTIRAESMANRLELHLASLHDLPSKNAAKPVQAETEHDVQNLKMTEPMFVRHSSGQIR